MSSDDRPRIERALAFITENIERPLTVAEVARRAHLSEFHFHRVFSAVMGEPVGRFITRRRLELAAMRLAYEPDKSVTEIALSVGYSSPSNFTKAFTAFFGRAPTSVRRADTRAVDTGRADPAALLALPPEADPAERRNVLDALGASVRFLDFAGLDLACLASEVGYELASLVELWADLIARGRQLGICEGDVDAYGLAFDSPRLTEPELCRYHACVPCASSVELPPPLFRGRIPEGRYAIFPYAGEVAGVERHYRSIYSIWFPASSVTPDDFVAIDHYVNDEPVDGRIDLEVWIKIRART